MKQKSDIKKTEVVLTRTTASRIRHRLADMILIISLAFGALPVANFGISDGVLIMLVVFYSTLIFVIGLREIAAMLLSVRTEHDEPPRWLTTAKSSIVVAVFLSLILGAAASNCMLAVSGQVRVVLMIVIVASLWVLMRCVGRRFLTEKSAADHASRNGYPNTE